VSVWRRGVAALRLLFFKDQGEQLGLFAPQEVQHPGIRGGKGYYDRWGHWQYGEKPAGFQATPTQPPAVAGDVPEGMYQAEPGGPIVPKGDLDRFVPVKSTDVVPGTITDVGPNPNQPTPDLTKYDIILVNSSAGKDSAASLDEVVRLAEKAGVRDRVRVVHADLGISEWKGVRELAERQAKALGLPFYVVRRTLGDLLAQVVEQRKKWPGYRPNTRFCTADQKTHQVTKLITALANDVRQKTGKKQPRILKVLGLRAAESEMRKEMDPFVEFDKDESSGRKWVDVWLPIHHWTANDVWRRIHEAGLEMHEAYKQGIPRLSCVFCIFANKTQLTLAGLLHPGLMREYVKAEMKIQHTFKPDLSLQAVLDDIEALVTKYGSRRAAIEEVQKDPKLQEHFQRALLLVRFWKAQAVMHPGSRGGKGYYTAEGTWIYGDRPEPKPSAQLPLLLPAPTPQRPIDTRAFKTWFGDWDADPAHASKVVDTEGEPEEQYNATGKHKPLVVYHGTQAAFTAFDPAKIGSWNLYGPGFYFTNNREVVEGVWEEGAKQVYFATKEEADAAPNRTGFTWHEDPGPYEWSDKWVATVRDRHLRSPGYQHKGELPLTQDERQRIADVIGAQVRKRQPGYLTKSEEERVWKELQIFTEPNSFMSLGQLHESVGEQPYNFNAYDAAIQAGIDIGGKIYPVYLNIRDPVDVEAKPTPDFLARITKAVQTEGNPIRAVSNTEWDKWWNEHAPEMSVQELLASMQEHQHMVRIAEGHWPGETVTKQDWPTLLKSAGYDGITHTGGLITGGEKHRVWIAFDPHQIKAVENVGTWDPSTADIFKAEPVLRPGSRGGHFRVTEKGEIRYDRPGGKYGGYPQRREEAPAADEGSRRAAETAAAEGTRAVAPGPVPLDQLNAPHAEATLKSIYGRFGTVEAGHDTLQQLKIYKLHDVIEHRERTQKMLDDLGFKVEEFAFTNDPEAGVKFRVPDLKRKGYESGTLWIYNPKLAHGSFEDEEYTRQWRIYHEAGHGISEPLMQAKYGTSHREGRLGIESQGVRGNPAKRTVPVPLRPLTLMEAQRAVEWEDLAFRIQRILLHDYAGVEISDADFNREHNTNIADATFRVLTGDFGDPGHYGFLPAAEKANTRELLRFLQENEEAIAKSQGREPTKGIDLAAWQPVSDAELRAYIQRHKSTAVAITSYRGEAPRTGEQVEQDAQALVQDLQHEGVQVAEVRRTRGAWVDSETGKLGTEPSMRLTLRGDEWKMLPPLARAGQRWNQDGVLVMGAAQAGDQRAQRNWRWDFGHALTSEQADTIQAAAKDAGLAGWTIDERAGTLFVQTIADYQAPEVTKAAAEKLTDMFNRAGTVKLTKSQAAVRLLGKHDYAGFLKAQGYEAPRSDPGRAGCNRGAGRAGGPGTGYGNGPVRAPSFAASAVLAFNARLRAGTHTGKNQYGMPHAPLIFLRYSRDGLVKAAQLGFKPFPVSAAPFTFHREAT